MFPWFWIWSPTFEYPYSGDVAQRIAPTTHWFFQGINARAGNARIEEKAFAVASYGKQLGLITEVLLELAEKTGVEDTGARESLERLQAINNEIEALKHDDYESAAEDIEQRIQQFLGDDANRRQALAERLLPLLTDRLPPTGPNNKIPTSD